MKSMTSHESQEMTHEKLNVLLKGLGMMLLGLSLTTCPAYQKHDISSHFQCNEQETLLN